MSPRYNTITQNPGKKIAAVNEDLVDLADNLKAALDNDPTNASVSEGSGYLDLAKELKQIKDSLSISNNTINNFNLELETLKQNVPVNLNPVIFNPVWSETPNYELPTINNGSYPLFGLDHNINDALTVIYTDGLSEDWQTDFTNGTIQKQLVSNLSNSLKYMGSGSIKENSLVSTKEYSVADGFNFSCFVTLSDGASDGTVLGYNPVFDASGMLNYDGLTVSGTTEVDLVMVKDQDSSKVRVWKNGVEDNATVFPDFTGGRLVVIANSNATFSEVKLTDTTVDLGISSMLKEYTHARIATIQAANPITQQNVEDYAKINVVVRNETIRIDPTKDYSGVGYVLKVGAAQYYQVSAYDSVLLEAELVKRIGNAIIGSDLALGGNGTGATFAAATSNLDNPKSKSVTLSLKYYSKDIASLREQLTAPAPTVGFGDLTPVTQAIVLAGYKASLVALGATPPADNVIIAALRQTLSGYSLIQTIFTVAFGSRPVQTAPEFINSADTVVVTQTNPSGDFTAQNIESYKQISNKLVNFNLSPVGANMTVTNNNDFTSAIAVSTTALVDAATQAPYQYAGIIPTYLVTTSWTLNTLDPSGLDAVISSSSSVPDYDTWVSYELTAIADQFKSSVGGSVEAFNALSYKAIAQIFLRGNLPTINNLNGDYIPNMSSLLTGDEQKFRKALAMKESADVQSALTIPDSDRFFYIVFGLTPNSTTIPVSWSYLPTDRNNNSVWTYVRVIDRNFGSYLDVDTRTESSVTFYENTTNTPENVISAFNTFYSFTLDDNSLSVDKYLVRYTGVVEYYIYADMTTTVPTFYILFSPLNSTITDDANRTWLDPITLGKANYQQFEQTPPPDDKLDYKVYKTWAEVEARLIDLRTL